MNEHAEELRTEDPLVETSPESAPQATVSAWTGPAWLRLAYAFEFLIALITIFMVWSEVGGQGHMDLLPWYVKLGLALAGAWCSVRFTAAMVEHEKAWNVHSAMWFAWIILVVAAMGGITYYYHLHEVPDESDTEDTTSTSLRRPGWSEPLDREAPLYFLDSTVVFCSDRNNA